ncbi:hypothetical protein GH714_020588 [Hevea brasiliensis]|uniref:Terpene synthase N-terminal domain-containing protein n=1 Tax=Hevea brasiliensis TaxID=3981 RepID=A0A6A6K7Z8_HEVBR|nr:hypothetical protein GH714_020588 [Hevea brasiliensis]
MVSPKLAKKTIVRRSANYQPSIWDYDFVQSLKTEYVGEVCTKRINKLKEEVRLMLKQAVNPLDQLQLIDTLQRLGLAYHFEDEIKRILMSIYTHDSYENTRMREDLYATALEFRLLRQQGYKIPQEIFNSFRDEMGNFKMCLSEDWEGMLSLYEASFLSEEGESILQFARDFTTTSLKKFGEKLSFARDRIVENFLWTIGETFEPQFSYCRRMSTKVNSLLTIIDDIYDVYGTLDELELFTDAVQRWDVNAIEQLPDYMKLCFLSLYNTINEIAFDVLKEQEFHIIPYLKKADELKRGDVPKSIQCYMHETGASEAKARDHIRFLISETWNKMNKERVADSPFSETFIGVVINLARMAQCMYQYGDGHGIGNHETKDHVLSLLVQPIPCLSVTI